MCDSVQAFTKRYGEALCLHWLRLGVRRAKRAKRDTKEAALNKLLKTASLTKLDQLRREVLK